MKLTIFGATGRTGQYLVEQALAAGHEVTAFVRSPEKLTIQDDNLTVYKGDVFNAEQVAGAIAGADAVLSVLGPVRGGPEGLMTASAANIIAGMKQHGVRRLVWSTGAGVNAPQDKPTLMQKLIGLALKVAAGSVMRDSAAGVALVQQSGLDWVIVRGPMLTDEGYNGRYQATFAGPEMNRTLARGNFAHFMLAQVDNDQWLHQMPAVSDK
jgi:putative NADH-flavin reductase